MKRISIALTAIIISMSLSTYAQDGNSTTTSSSSMSSSSPSALSQQGLGLSVGPEFVIPVGTFRSESGYKFGLGGSAKLVLPFTNNIAGSISVGYIGFSQSKFDSVTSKNTFTTIPFKAGIRFMTNGFYVEPQAGYTQTKQTNEEGSGQFTYALNLGYLINKMIDISARYEAISASLNDPTISGITDKRISAKMIGVRLAYNFNFARVK